MFYLRKCDFIKIKNQAFIKTLFNLKSAYLVYQIAFIKNFIHFIIYFQKFKI